MDSTSAQPPGALFTAATLVKSASACSFRLGSAGARTRSHPAVILSFVYPYFSLLFFCDVQQSCPRASTLLDTSQTNIQPASICQAQGMLMSRNSPLVGETREEEEEEEERERVCVCADVGICRLSQWLQQGNSRVCQLVSNPCMFVCASITFTCFPPS